MNSQIADEVFMSPVAAHHTAQGIPIGQGVFKIAAAKSIVNAVQSGFFNTNLPIGSTSSADAQYVVRLLNTAGYSAQITGSNLAIAW